jgi:hypothetical protein
MTTEIQGYNNPVMSTDEKQSLQSESGITPAAHVEELNSTTDLGNLVYANEEEEPELHFPTYIALVSIYVLLAGQGLALQGPSSKVR